jgi:hypothetical protein
MYKYRNKYLLLMESFWRLEKPLHEDVWESGGIAPRFLNLGARWG